ncbi:MAG: hypothetical protein WCZ90_20200 [Melioribacteraceae bacterium]
MKLLKLRHMILLAALGLFSHCGDKNKSDDNTELYTTDKSQIGIEISDEELGVKFNPPKDWELTPSSLSKKIENRNNPGDGFIYEPVYVFFDKVNGSVLSGGKVNSTDSLVSKSSEINFYKGLLSAKYKNSKMSLHNFVQSGISFTLVRFSKENLTAHKLFFQNSKQQIVQLEYSFRKDFADSVLPAIKASIGSVRLIN